MEQKPLPEGAKIITKRVGNRVEAHLLRGDEPGLALGRSDHVEGFIWLVKSAAAFHNLPVEEM